MISQANGTRSSILTTWVGLHSSVFTLKSLYSSSTLDAPTGDDGSRSAGRSSLMMGLVDSRVRTENSLYRALAPGLFFSGGRVSMIDRWAIPTLQLITA